MTTFPLSWLIVDARTGASLDTCASLAELRQWQQARAAENPIRVWPMTSPKDRFPPASATCTITEWLAYQIRTERGNHAAAWARKDFDASGLAEREIDLCLDQLARLAAVTEQGALAPAIPADQGVEIEGAPRLRSTWRHRNGNRYEVLALLNVDTTRPEVYPVSVAYQGENGKTWVRALDRWHASMTWLSDEPMTA